MAIPPSITLSVAGNELLCDRVEVDLALSRPFVIRARESRR